MAYENNLKKSYATMPKRYEYSAEENAQSLQKLHKLLPELDRAYIAEPTYAKDLDDLEFLKLIYET